MNYFTVCFYEVRTFNLLKKAERKSTAGHTCLFSFSIVACWRLATKRGLALLFQSKHPCKLVCRPLENGAYDFPFLTTPSHHQS